MDGSTTRAQTELKLTGKPDQIAHESPRQNRYRRSFILGLLVAWFLIIESFIPLKTAVQIGADEGFELAKATLCLHGQHLDS